MMCSPIMVSMRYKSHIKCVYAPNHTGLSH